jgi:hypothetical protein
LTGKDLRQIAGVLFAFGGEAAGGNGGQKGFCTEVVTMARGTIAAHPAQRSNVLVWLETENRTARIPNGKRKFKKSLETLDRT